MLRYDLGVGNFFNSKFTTKFQIFKVVLIPSQTIS